MGNEKTWAILANEVKVELRKMKREITETLLKEAIEALEYIQSNFHQGQDVLKIENWLETKRQEFDEREGEQGSNIVTTIATTDINANISIPNNKKEEKNEVEDEAIGSESKIGTIQIKE